MSKRDKQFWIVVFIMSILIILLVYIALTLPEKSATCLNYPLDYYEYINNATCWCIDGSTTSYS